MAQNPPVRIEAPNASSTNKSTCIFLHGFGDDAEGWTDIARQFQAAHKLPHMSWLFPNAPISNESGTSAWFEPGELTALPVGRSTNEASNAAEDDDIEDLDVDGILRSLKYLCGLIDEEIEAGVDVGRIVVGGFSQGSVQALMAGLASRYAGRLAGVVGLSGAFPGGKVIGNMRDEVKGQLESGESSMRVFLAHGTKDMMVPMRMFRDAKEKTEKALGEERVTAKIYEGMGHQTAGVELRDVCEFLEAILPE